MEISHSRTVVVGVSSRQVDKLLLQRLGYWGEMGSGLPELSSWINKVAQNGDSELVAEHLGRGFVARAYMGNAACRICGDQIGSLELTDGVYIWPEGLHHYVTAHAVGLPLRFVEHVRAFADRIESADVDEMWWRSLAD